MGAKNSYIRPDQLTFGYLEERAKRKFEAVYPGADAEYSEIVEINAETLEPVIACPHTVDNVKPFRELGEVQIQQAFLGTCTNGRYEDLERAAAVLRGKKIKKGVRMVVIPASQEIYLQALENGLLKTFVEAGAVVESPGCGPCMGNHLGIRQLVKLPSVQQTGTSWDEWGPRTVKFIWQTRLLWLLLHWPVK